LEKIGKSIELITTENVTIIRNLSMYITKAFKIRNVYAP